MFHELHSSTGRKCAALPDADFVNEILDLITANKEWTLDMALETDTHRCKALAAAHTGCLISTWLLCESGCASAWGAFLMNPQWLIKEGNVFGPFSLVKTQNFLGVC